MKAFKKSVNIESITTSLLTGRPLSRDWGFPEFLLDVKFESSLKGLFGENGFKLYSKMNDKDKKIARKFFETHGEEVAKMYKADIWEDWNDSKDFKFDLQYLFDNHNDVYQAVAKNIAKRSYGIYPAEIFDLILDKFLTSPKDFSETIVYNIKQNKQTH